MIKDINVRKQILFKKSFLDEVEKACDIEIRSLSNIVTIALKEYLEKVKAAK